MPLEHPLGTAESCMAPVRQNFEQVRPALKDKADLQQLDALEAWAESSFERLLPVLLGAQGEGASSANATATSTWATPR
ncbi:hypothetical protein ACPA9J_20875 [Pseudomonas aeruginosa]